MSYDSQVMAADSDVPCNRSRLLSPHYDTIKVEKCVSCINKQRQIDDILAQLKSLQEMTESQKRDSSGDWKDPYDQVTDEWICVPSKRSYGDSKSTKSFINSSSRSIMCKNKYSTLSSLTDNSYLAVIFT
jgi:hypothetical protein